LRSRRADDGRGEDERGACQKRREAESAPRYPQTVRPGEPVRQPSARQIRDASEQERQRRKEPAGEERKPEDADQKRRQPGEVKVETVAEREIHRADGVQISARQQRPPGRGGSETIVANAVLLDPRELLARDARMLSGLVSKPRVPGRRPDDPERAEDQKAGAPAPSADEQERNRRRQHAAGA